MLTHLMRDLTVLDQLNDLKSNHFASPDHAVAFELIRGGVTDMDALRAGLINAMVKPTLVDFIVAGISGDRIYKLTRVDEEIARIAQKGAPEMGLDGRRLSEDGSKAIALAEQILLLAQEREINPISTSLVSSSDGLRLDGHWAEHPTPVGRIAAYLILAAGGGIVVSERISTLHMGALATTLASLGLVLLSLFGVLVAEVDFKTLIIDDWGLIGVYLGSALILAASTITLGGRAFTPVIAALVFIAGMIVVSVLLTKLIFPHLRGRNTLGFGDVLLLPAVVSTPAALLISTHPTLTTAAAVTGVSVTLITIAGALIPAVIAGISGGKSRPFALGPYLVVGIPFVFVAVAFAPVRSWIGL